MLLKRRSFSANFHALMTHECLNEENAKTRSKLIQWLLSTASFSADGGNYDVYIQASN